MQFLFVCFSEVTFQLFLSGSENFTSLYICQMKLHHPVTYVLLGGSPFTQDKTQFSVHNDTMFC